MVGLSSAVNGLNEKFDPAGVDVSTDDSSLKCSLQGATRSPEFSQGGDFLIGGVFSIHYQHNTMIYNYTFKPEPPRCTGRLVAVRD